MEIVNAPNDVQTPVGMVSRTEGPTQEEWEAHRATISAFYRGEKLAKVREIMRRDYCFDASERMYKTRVKHWGLDKKAKANEMSHALRIIQRRKAEGKDTVTVIREKVVDEAQVQKYLRRQRISKSKTTSGKILPAGRTPPVVTYFTPPSTSSRISVAAGTITATDDHPTTCPRANISGKDRHQTRLASKHDLLAFMDLLPFDLVPLPPPNVPSWDESALTELRNYYDTYFQYPQWQVWTDTRLSWDKTPGEFLIERDATFALPELEDPAQIVGSFQIATRLYGTDSAREAYTMKDEAFEKVSKLVREQHPQLLSCLLLLICLLDTTGFPELTQQLLYHTHNMAHIILGSTHHITRLTSWFAHSENRSALADRAFECIQDFYARQAGYLHPQHLELAYNHAWSLFLRGRLDDAKTRFQKLYQVYESFGKFDGLRARKVLYSMAQVEIAQGFLDAADILLVETQRRIARRFGHGTLVEMRFECLRLRATLRQGSGPAILPVMSEALEDAQSFLGSTHPTVILLKYAVQTYR
jgi:hypothetical protein